MVQYLVFIANIMAIGVKVYIYLVEPFINMLLFPFVAFLFYKKQLYGWILRIFIYLRAVLNGTFYVDFLYDSGNSLFSIMTLGYCILFRVLIQLLLNTKMKDLFEVDRKKSHIVSTISILISFILLIYNIGVL